MKKAREMAEIFLKSEDGVHPHMHEILKKFPIFKYVLSQKRLRTLL